jgi:predicted negative regulator of RcsB-dependent stress response
MNRILDRLLRSGKNNKLLDSLKEKAQKNPQNCQMQVRLGDLLVKMGKKEAAIRIYHDAAQKFSQRGFVQEALALNKILLRLDPLRKAVLRKVARRARP